MPNAFYQNDEEITDPLITAENFNKYFVQVGPNLAKTIPESAKPFKKYLGRNVSESFSITPVTEDEVERELIKLNPNQSSGFDDLQPKVILSNVAHLIKYSLKIIYNNSLSSGVIPEQLKVSRPNFTNIQK